MKKLLFMAPIELEDKNSGVTTKVKNQYSVFNTHFDAFLCAFTNKSVVIMHNDEIIVEDKNDSKHRVFRQFNIVKEFCEKSEISFLYIRYSLSFPQFIHMLRNVKPLVEKIVVECPDYPYIQEWTKTKRYIQAFMDCIFNKQLRKYVDHIFTCSDHTSVMGIESSRLLNGTNISEYNLRELTDTNNIINVLCIAILNISTGADRFIQGLADYKKNGGNRVIKLHIVGDGPEAETYKKLISDNNLENDVIMYGFMPMSEANAIFNKCDMGLGAVAFHRIGISSDSTLKSREYGLRGMPIIAENKIDILGDDFRYIDFCPFDDSPIDMRQVIDFYDRCFGMSDKTTVAKAIREYFINRCDIQKTMLPVIDYLKL